MFHITYLKADFIPHRKHIVCKKNIVFRKSVIYSDFDTLDTVGL